MAALLLIAGVVLLYLGGELLVANASRLARAFGLSSLVIGLTVVAFATSAPELFATLMAAYQGSPELGLGNVLGSNIANLGLILGFAAIVRPLLGKARFLRREIPLLVAVAILPFFVLSGDVIGRLEGGILFAGLVIYIVFLLRSKESPELEAEITAELADAVHMDPEAGDGAERAWWISALGVVAGLALLVLGADWLVDGGVTIARALGVSERVIGLTLVAFGTSLPELASSVAAARRKEGDIVLGNVVGSNIFNVLCVLGLTSLLHPIAVDRTGVLLDLWVGLAFSVAMIPLLLVGRSLYLGRWEGALLVTGYLVYIGVLFI